MLCVKNYQTFLLFYLYVLSTGSQASFEKQTFVLMVKLKPWIHFIFIGLTNKIEVDFFAFTFPSSEVKCESRHSCDLGCCTVSQKPK